MVLSRMRILYALTVMSMLALATVPRAANAYDFSGAGGKLGYANPEDLDGTAMLGVHAELEQHGTRVHLLPNIMYWNVNRVRDVNPNFDVYYHFHREGRMSPYLGGGLGLNFVRYDRTDRSDTDLGMNLLGGLRFPGTSNHYFLEGRYTASYIPQVSLLGGVTFHGGI